MVGWFRRQMSKGIKMQSNVEAVRTIKLVLKSSFYLDLENTFYVPTFSRNLIFVTHLVSLGFKFVLNSQVVIYITIIIILLAIMFYLMVYIS